MSKKKRFPYPLVNLGEINCAEWPNALSVLSDGLCLVTIVFQPSSHIIDNSMGPIELPPYMTLSSETFKGTQRR